MNNDLGPICPTPVVRVHWLVLPAAAAAAAEVLTSASSFCPGVGMSTGMPRSLMSRCLGVASVHIRWHEK